MYLVDTNVWLELLLEQENAATVRQSLFTIHCFEAAQFLFIFYL